MTDAAVNFLAIADFLIPAHKSMPAFSSICSWDDAQAAVNFRVDLKEGLQRAVSRDATADAGAYLADLRTNDPSAFDAVSTITIATYYMNAQVRTLIGYPGQENVSYDPQATQAYLTDGSLGKVVARGVKYRATPGL